MKKKKKYIAVLVLFSMVLAATLIFLVSKSVGGRDGITTVHGEIRTISTQVMAAGTIRPRIEVQVKSPLSGVVDELFIEAGDTVQQGTPLLSIRVVPKSLDLNSAESSLSITRIQLEEAEIAKKRSETLYKSRAISEVDYNEAVTQWRLAKQRYSEAHNRILLLKEGRLEGDSAINNIIYAPITGTVLSLPLKSGAAVQENGGMSEGTTVALMADMKTLYFSGTVDEAEVGRLTEGLPVEIIIAAVDGLILKGELSFISPRGESTEGAVMFPIEIDLSENKNSQLRAGFSANAQIILGKAENILALQERDIRMDQGSFFVDVWNGKEAEPRKIIPGISDGVYTEIISGITQEEEILVH